MSGLLQDPQHCVRLCCTSSSCMCFDPTCLRDECERIYKPNSADLSTPKPRMGSRQSAANTEQRACNERMMRTRVYTSAQEKTMQQTGLRLE